MTRKADKLASLAALAGLVADRALLPVAQAEARLARARMRAEALAQARGALASSVTDPLQAALMARQAERLRHSQIAAMSDLARCQVDVELAKDAARPAYGRKLALERLLAQRKPRP
jgi:hypothetical protein